MAAESSHVIFDELTKAKLQRSRGVMAAERASPRRSWVARRRLQRSRGVMAAERSSTSATLPTDGSASTEPRRDGRGELLSLERRDVV